MNLTEELKKKIDAMSHEDLARSWRFTPVGDEFWQGESGRYAQERFDALGHMTPEISKRIGWDK